MQSCRFLRFSLFTFLQSQQGYGCLTLQKHEVKHLYGPSDLDNLPVGPKVCIGAGTGLGECYLTPNDETVAATPPSKSSFFSSAAVSYKAAAVSYTCFASEGGHVEYAPRNDVEIEMFHYLQHKFSGQGRISVERVVSGVGLANVYEFLAATYPSRIVQSVHDAFLIAGDEQGRVVAQNAHAEAASSSSSLSTGSLCQQAMSIMMSAYGCEVGSAAIKWIPTGGLFVTGGLTPKNIDYIEGLHTDFMISYLHKGRVRPLLERVPLFAVMVEDLGVRGVHKAALMEYEKYVESSSMSSGPDQRRNNNSSSFAVAQLWEQIVNGGNTTSSASSSMLLVSSLVLTTAAVAGFVAGRAHHHRGRP
jgi:glucokinase